MTTFYTSDCHFGHTNIIKFASRPFDSVPHMNESLIANWNETVTPDDTVMVLGDFVMGKKDETLPLVERLNGTIYLVPGNHDRVHPMDKQCAKWTPIYEAVGINIVTPEVSVLDDPFVTLCHFPFDGDSHHEDRYTELRPRDEGQILFHGHVHEEWQVRGRQINVGCDVWDFRPVTREQLLHAYERSLES